MLTSLLILIAAVVFGGLWGCIQGMIMIQPWDAMVMYKPSYPGEDGIRNHLWCGSYHRLCVYCLLAFTGLVILWWENIPSEIGTFVLYLVFTIGCMLIGWGTAEAMYSKARYDKYITNRGEHINFADLVSIRLSAVKTKVLCLGRYIGGLLLVIVAIFHKKKSPR